VGSICRWVIECKGSGAGVILEGLTRLTIEQFLRFEFKTTNNQVEYEAIIAG